MHFASHLHYTHFLGAAFPPVFVQLTDCMIIALLSTACEVVFTFPDRENLYMRHNWLQLPYQRGGRYCRSDQASKGRTCAEWAAENRSWMSSPLSCAAMSDETMLGFSRTCMAHFKSESKSRQKFVRLMFAALLNGHSQELGC